MRKGRSQLIIAAAAAVVTLSAASAPAIASGGWKLWKSPNAGGSDENYLVGAAATSSTNAWAVGYYEDPSARTLIERWNGTGWEVQRSPNQGGRNRENWLYGVAATSPTNAWAVGHVGHTDVRTLIEHWNGVAWKMQPSPNPGGSAHSDRLAEVAGTSPTDAWAVGHYRDGNANRTLIEHSDGAAWRVQPSPNLGGIPNGQLYGVAATSSTDVWAVGHYWNGSASQALIEHWNGTAWTVQPSPNRGGSSRINSLFGVAATSPTNAWAVGHSRNGRADQTLIEHWNGTAWSVQPSPDPGGSTRRNILTRVSAESPTDAWAVGSYADGTTIRTLVEHWNGNRWKVESTPDPAGATHGNRLWDVAAYSPTGVWAVGYYENGATDRNIILHCC